MHSPDKLSSSSLIQPNAELPIFHTYDDPRRSDRVHKITVYRRPTPSSVALYRVVGWVSANMAVWLKSRFAFWVAVLCVLVSVSHQRVTETSRWRPYVWVGLAVTWVWVYVVWIPSLGSLVGMIEEEEASVGEG